MRLGLIWVRSFLFIHLEHVHSFSWKIKFKGTFIDKVPQRVMLIWHFFVHCKKNQMTQINPENRIKFTNVRNSQRTLKLLVAECHLQTLMIMSHDRHTEHHWIQMWRCDVRIRNTNPWWPESFISSQYGESEQKYCFLQQKWTTDSSGRSWGCHPVGIQSWGHSCTSYSGQKIPQLRLTLQTSITKQCILGFGIFLTKWCCWPSMDWRPVPGQ